MYIQPKTLLLRWQAALSAEPGITVRVFAMRNGMTEEVALARLDTARKEREIAGRVEYSLGQPLKLEGDWMIVGDVHCPFTDYDFANLVSMVAKKNLRKPRRLLIAGDFFNMDTFSNYAHLTNIPTWAQEREAARGLLDEWLGTFSEIVALMGNHDRRLQKFTGGAFDDTDIFGMIISNRDRVKTSNFGWCTVESGGQVYRVTHPQNYSVNQLNLASELALKFDTNIISFHEHRAAIGTDRFGKHVVVNGGCLVEPEKLAYVVMDDSKSPAMVKGFVMLRNGYPYLFSNGITDWSKWV